MEEKQKLKEEKKRAYWKVNKENVGFEAKRLDFISKKGIVKIDKNMGKIVSKRIAGITLVALVVTIVVLLILAGITINLVLSDDGIFKKAEQAGAQSKVATIEEKANIIYADKQLEKISSGSKTKPTMEDVVQELGKNAEK